MELLLQPAFDKHRVFANAHYPSLFPGGDSLHVIDQHYQFSRFHSTSLLAFLTSRWRRTGVRIV
jgi:hypothetical protein